ncbi:cyanoexosortase A system-associated protein [Lyngbya confervoides]|uniref:Cyanoexosortase A system-associated protein n=1 Tax=Lyngbya confervoides BDU141951 TaxID=1574623 RepID=A0ABD4T8E1_9CYAN|nr:cyanoexosortase A system-associated protein [Lyngbya confervoides]MCM1984891.1 cyanoexosortase A system-associated protein [Lyngbya confervoides BDU141951]
MNFKLGLRNSLSILVFFSSVFVLVKVTVAPATDTQKADPFAFPNQIQLSQWQALPSQRLLTQDIGLSKYLGGRRYQYQKNGTSLLIELYHFTNSDGEVKQFLKNKISSPSPLIQHKKNTGYYGLFTDQKRAYLSACINPSGNSTLTKRQFKQNRNTYDPAMRLLPWLLGKSNLIENRCMFVLLSTPLKQDSTIPYQILENVWSLWYQSWNYQFPIF